jgi:hypothetical protein
MDRDAAGQLFHGLAALERTRMSHESRTTYDSRFDAVKDALTLPRGTIDFGLPPEPRETLKDLAGRIKR